MAHSHSGLRTAVSSCGLLDTSVYCYHSDSSAQKFARSQNKHDQNNWGKPVYVSENGPNITWKFTAVKMQYKGMTSNTVATK